MLNDLPRATCILRVPLHQYDFMSTYAVIHVFGRCASGGRLALRGRHFLAQLSTASGNACPWARKQDNTSGRTVPDRCFEGRFTNALLPTVQVDASFDDCRSYTPPAWFCFQLARLLIVNRARTILILCDGLHQILLSLCIKVLDFLALTVAYLTFDVKSLNTHTYYILTLMRYTTGVEAVIKRCPVPNVHLSSLMGIRRRSVDDQTVVRSCVCIDFDTACSSPQVI